MGRRDNETTVTEFILLGLSSNPRIKIALFGLFLIVYLITVLGNGLLVLLAMVDPRLHTPMYFFLGNLSVLDICYTTSSIPQMLTHCLSAKSTISYARCFAQMYISLFLGMTECLLLAMMSYDRWVAVCNPLRYTLIMSKKVCIAMASFSWGSSLLLVMIPSLTSQKSLCGHNILDHFACEVQVMLKLFCSYTRINQIVMFATSILTLLLPFGFILITYARIIAAVLKMHSAENRSKVFSTCSSHLMVVAIFYGTAMSMYLQPQTKASSNHDKFVAVFYGTITPMLNPLIYSLRNKDVKHAFWKLAWKKRYL
ncbi:olfactory receptor 13H1-like [Hemicordylus capensis]|uniref:olfactory receptor 13H1-like n=1 Tax=Hemicordylus capensis TaxID=884348 RepID=UPI0023022BFE|nr:olfactory receptor 13H1-like [Hemicordylus capensis]